MSDRIPVMHPRLPAADGLLPYLQQIDASRIYSNWGPLVAQLELRLARHFGLPDHALTCAASGTAALVGAILATVGRATTDRPLALVPGFTFVATALAAEQCGYRPFLADVDNDTWMLDAERVEHHPQLNKIGVVIPVAPFGRSVPQAPWAEFRARTGIPVVIDGAASFEGAAAAPDRHLGTIPVAMSFHATKSFSTGEGGCVVSSDAELAARVMQALNFGFYDSRDCRLPSTNGKMSEYHAAVGLAELDGWEDKRSQLLAVADRYRDQLQSRGLDARFVGGPDTCSSYALFRCANTAESAHVQEALDAGNIGYRLWYGQGLADQTHFSNCPRDQLSVTEDVLPNLIGLPTAPDLPRAAISRVVRGLLDGLYNKR